MNTHYDLIVVGGGLTGVAAATAAGRAGLKALLIEKGGALGGAAVNCYVNPFMRYFTTLNAETRIVNKGIFIELVNQLDEMNGMVGKAFNEEYMKVLLDRMVSAAGVDVLFHTYFTEVEKEGDTITAIKADTRMGTFRYTADFFIDASGDAMLAYKAGCPYHVGREEDSACQPMTLCFRMAGVDYETFKMAKPQIQEKYKQLQKEGKIKNPRENVLTFRHTSNGILHLNSTRIVGLSPLSAVDLTKAQMQAREQMLELFTFLKENAPGCENASLLTSAPEIGVRESRMIDGEYTITVDDLLSCKQFEDSIAIGCYSVDIHSPDGSGTTIRTIPDGKHYTIPYRSLLPKKADNLLVAGRCISSTHEAQSAYRVLPIVCNIGEGAGIAVVTAKETGKSLREVDIALLQQKIKAAGLDY